MVASAPMCVSLG
ncbi:hypothetical protein Hamer_G010318 [Homarus americanus]|uniref:Uncharacterized protein n=1 Tax=Homarus americanus TaxID=6706 RepID=A0A8J5MWQ2_HOMAM|nr:hypothetical protein Hamer_G010318 [Homarus americanus]